VDGIEGARRCQPLVTLSMRRVGLIGFGSIAEHGHLPAWHSFPGVRVAAISDLSPERLQAAGNRLPDAQLFGSGAELIARSDVDILDICSPPSSHVDLLLAACERGIADIVSEKPFVLSEEEYARVARARAGSGSRVVSVNNWMHSDLHRQVSRVLSHDTIGAVQHVRLRTGRPDSAKGNSGWMPRWRVDPALSGGGIILDHGWHQLYLLLSWMCAPVVEVSAVTRVANPQHYPVEDEAIVDLDFGQSTGRIELSWTASGRTNEGCIQGEKGEIAIHDDRIVVHNGTSDETLPFGGRLTQSSYHSEWFEEMFRHNVLDESRLLADRNFSEAGALVGIIGAAYRSARDGGSPQRPSIPHEVPIEN
jgi:predicted dehydrogenase